MRIVRLNRGHGLVVCATPRMLAAGGLALHVSWVHIGWARETLAAEISLILQPEAI